MKEGYRDRGSIIILKLNSKGQITRIFPLQEHSKLKACFKFVNYHLFWPTDLGK